jgi:hypothetical protein
MSACQLRSWDHGTIVVQLIRLIFLRIRKHTHHATPGGDRRYTRHSKSNISLVPWSELREPSYSRQQKKRWNIYGRQGLRDILKGMQLHPS